MLKDCVFLTSISGGDWKRELEISVPVLRNMFELMFLSQAYVQVNILLRKTSGPHPTNFEATRCRIKYLIPEHTHNIHSTYSTVYTGILNNGDLPIVQKEAFSTEY